MSDYELLDFIGSKLPKTKDELRRKFPACEVRLKKLFADKLIDYYFDGERFHFDKIILRDKGILTLQDYKTQVAKDRRKLWESRFWKIISSVALLRAFAPELKEILSAIAQALVK